MNHESNLSGVKVRAWWILSSKMLWERSGFRLDIDSLRLRIQRNLNCFSDFSSTSCSVLSRLDVWSPGTVWWFSYREKDWGENWPFFVMGGKVPKQEVSGLSLRNLLLFFLCDFLLPFLFLNPSFRSDFNQSLVQQVCLSFYETRSKHMAWFSKVERLYWEQWCIQLHVVPPAPLKAKKFYDSSQSGETGGRFLSGTHGLDFRCSSYITYPTERSE